MIDTSNNLRAPSFMSGVNIDRKVESAGFLGEHRRALVGAAALDGSVEARQAMSAGRSTADELYGVGEMDEAQGNDAVAVVEPSPPPPAPVVDMSRMEAAIDRLRLLSERLTAEARSDALELGLMIARKVVEGELSVNADRLIGVVKSAVSRVGESRRIAVHLSPEDAEMLTGPPQAAQQAIGDGVGSDAGADAGPKKPHVPTGLARISRGAAQIEIVADATLSRGDCVVEGDHLSVDATLDTKFGEIRRALLETAWQEHQ